jgi:hypothetical protein
VPGQVYIFCALEPVFNDIEGVGSSFHVMRNWTYFRRYRGRQVQFSYFTLPDSFWEVQRAPDLIFMFCAPELVLGGTESVRSNFHVLRSQTCFGRSEGTESSFHVLRGTKGVRSNFHVLHFLTRFARYQGRQVQFSCFALLDPFCTVPRASGPVFMFCAPELVLGGTESVGSSFHVLRSWTRFGRSEGERAHFSCSALLDSFSAVPRASGPVFMVCAPGVIFGGIEGVRSRFHDLRSQNNFGWY